MSMTDELTAIFKMSPPVVFVLVLNGIGFMLTSSKWFRNDFIPIILMFLGALTWPWIADTASVAFTARYPVVVNGMYGAALGLGAVGVNQAYRRLLQPKSKTVIETNTQTTIEATEVKPSTETRI